MTKHLCRPAAATSASTALQVRSYGWGASSNAFEETFETRLRRARQRPSYAFGPSAYPKLLDGGPRPAINLLQPTVVPLVNRKSACTTIIDTAGRPSYCTLSARHAFRCPNAVGRTGPTSSGTEKISRIAAWTDWHPSPEMRGRDPQPPEKMLGEIRNLVGAVALYLGNSLYRIHEPNDPKSIGFASSSGCFRMISGHSFRLAMCAKDWITVKVLPG